MTDQAENLRRKAEGRAAIEKRSKHISFGCRGLSRDGTVGKSMRDSIIRARLGVREW